MKLNKVLALALSGIMAVSMLAGCSNNTNGGKDEQTPATGIVAAVNNGQTTNKNVKVTFAADATLDSQLNKAIVAAGNDADYNVVREALRKIITEDTEAVYNAATAKDALNPVTSGASGAVAEGEKNVAVAVYKVADNYTETAALKDIASQVDTLTSTLMKDTSKNVKVGQKYVAYDYTGKVSMVEVENLDGTTNYYAAVVITSNYTVKTVTV